MRRQGRARSRRRRGETSGRKRRKGGETSRRTSETTRKWRSKAMRRVATQPNTRRTRAAQPNARREEEECGKTRQGVRTNMTTAATAAQRRHDNDN